MDSPSSSSSTSSDVLDASSTDFEEEIVVKPAVKSQPPKRKPPTKPRQPLKKTKKTAQRRASANIRELVLDEVKKLFNDKNNLHTFLIPVEMDKFKMYVPTKIRSAGVE